MFEFFFGGTFDPIHFGHLAIIEALQKTCQQIPVRIIPCAIPALKNLPATTFSQRVDMLKLATGQLEHIIIDTRESERKNASYTIDTLESLKLEFINKRFILVMGMDTILDLKKWHRWQDLVKYCHLIIVNRPNFDSDLVEKKISETDFNLVNHFDDLLKKECGNAWFLTMPNHLHSSTNIRQKIPIDTNWSSLLPKVVADYIKDNHLYESEKN